ncbi:MAG: methylenetetrahydrofolate reductase [Deltaproteobacteria bacterium]|nr:methylenetetrahydrofolate reductase [Deltaproteobacteria bacterium]
MLLREKIGSKKFIILGEIDPPKGTDFSLQLRNAVQAKGRVDAIVVPEMANAVLKASSLGGCAVFKKEGVETIYQICCRDRNRLALQADLLAAGALGIENLMVVPGEDIRYGDHPNARTVNDLDLMELLDAVQTLQRGRDMAGIELRGTPSFCVGSVIDTSASGGLLELELENLKKMVELGVEYVVTNPIFDTRLLQGFVRRIERDAVSVIPRVLLLKSAGMARYIDRNIKEISIPQEIIRSIQKAPDKVKECIKIAAQTINRIKDMGFAGVLISTLGWEDKLNQILDEAGI